eukprot:1737500-Lingulodinium_polyedra.AAC.1
MALTAEQQEAALAKAAPELAFLLNENDVAVEIQARIYHSGVTTLRRFANLEESKAGVRKVLDEQLEMRGADSMEMRRHIADVLGAWEAAGIQAKRENEVRAEKRAEQLPRPLGGLEHRAMRSAYEALHGELPPREVPGRFFLGIKLEQVEENEPR